MNKDLFALSSYQFDLPKDLIAQHPCEPRDQSRLMVIDRKAEKIYEMPFRDLADLMHSGDSLVFNDTKVIPARLFGKKQSGGAAEIFLVRQLAFDTWEVLARPGKKLLPGTKVHFAKGFACEILDTLESGCKIVRFEWEGNFNEVLGEHGKMPLPHYIRDGKEDLQDRQSYQTIYARHAGALAAPTAGLHFTESLLQELKDKGVEETTITLHVGLGTFKPVRNEDIRDFSMHFEPFIISQEAADRLNKSNPKGRRICVGTTSCRALESAATEDGLIVPGSHETNIFIYPGYRFKYVEHLLTNFHLPGSTLLMLVCTFAGYDLMMEAYKKAIKDRFRFFSYGDAMLIL